MEKFQYGFVCVFPQLSTSAVFKLFGGDKKKQLKTLQKFKL